MTPKEKADEICRKMLHQIEWNAQPSTVKKVAKQCALIAVDEIREHASPYFIENEDGKFVSFWQEVKQEIDKL